ncbi:2-hydroxyacid dehydrogenase [Niallia sp. Krafla_26]|uniref:2-hydroxyacid dehydrogenase n=1 Tax=Niallia sp. Krafla_26 TaxID=3064703 RepID=UPI003D18127D
MAKVVVIGDGLVSSDTLEDAAYGLDIEEPIEVKKFEWYSHLEKNEFQECIKIIETQGPENVEIPEGIFEELETADYLLLHYAPVSRKMVECANNLKLIGTCRGGMENVNIPACDEKRIPVLHVFRNVEPVADFTIGLMFAETRNIARAHHAILEGNWRKTFVNDPYKTTLSQLKVGIYGLGNISKAVIRRLNALGVEVLANSNHANLESLEKEGLKLQLVDVETLFSESDIVSLHARVTLENKNVVNKRLLDLMKPSGYLINTARPDLVNKEDLIDALKHHRIAGAALDVFWTEPIDTNDEILQLDNVTFTTHIAGDTVDAIPKSPYLLRDVLNDYFKNKKSSFQVNLK